jgi:cyanate permease
MTTIKIGSLSIVLALSSGIAAQVSAQSIGGEATWAVQFLTEWGWLGLFVLSAFLNIYQFKRADRQATSGTEQMNLLRSKYETEVDSLRDKHERDLKDATDRLIQEYQIRIQQLSVGRGGN